MAACRPGAALPGSIAARSIVWLTVLALPLQGLAAVAAELRGPAHYHATAGDKVHEHGQGLVERHFHTHDHGAIQADDDDHHRQSPAVEPGKSGASGGLDTQAPASARASVQFPLGDAVFGYFKKPAIPFQGRLERPPA